MKTNKGKQQHNQLRSAYWLMGVNDNRFEYYFDLFNS